MKLIELHILQSFPVTCLNRDDVGAPKTAYFGGCQRARVSSQCWKRAIRLLAKKEAGEDLFGGARTRKAMDDLGAELQRKGMAESEARQIAADVCERLLKKGDDEVKGRGKGKKKEAETQEPAADEPLGETSTLLYFCPAEIEKMAETILAAHAAGTSGDKLKEAVVKAVPDAHLKDGADIAIFGRMVASANTLTLEGAGLFSHALSTHRVDNDIDFWTAVDDKKQEGDDARVANMGDIEFNSACYYRYIGLNMDLLADKKHLHHLTEDERQKVVKAFLCASIMAMPPARKNSMFGFSPPAYVLGLRRTGQPLSLVNAFERPVQSSDGYDEPSKKAMLEWWAKLQKLYGLKADVQSELPPDSLDDLIKKLA